MTNIAAKDVMNLRKRTGVSMMACKEALTEAEGDEEKAIEILRKKGVAKAAKKADRETSEGAVAISDRALVSVSCETDFVARNEDFLQFLADLAKLANEQGVEVASKDFESKKAEMIAKIGENLELAQIVKLEKGDTAAGFKHFNNKAAAIVALNGGSEELAKEIAMHVVAMNPEYLSPDLADEQVLIKEREIWQSELEKSSKPAEIITKIMAGKEKKFREENALITQAFVKDDQVSVGEYAKQNGAEVVEFVRVAI
jgi:elongation factor Ts